MTEGGLVIPESLKGGSLNVTCPYRLGGRLFGTPAKTYKLCKLFRWLTVGKSPEPERVTSQ